MKQTATILCIVGALALGTTTAAQAAPPSKPEQHYLQLVDAISKVNGALWQSFKKSGGTNVQLARYCARVTEFNRRQLSKQTPPATELWPMHRSLQRILDGAQKLYAAVAKSDWHAAKRIGKQIQTEMVTFRKVMGRLAGRYR